MSRLSHVGYSNNFLQVMSATEADRKGLYRNKNIQKVVNAMWFAKKQDEGVIYYEYFKPLSDVTFSLVLTAVRPFFPCFQSYTIAHAFVDGMRYRRMGDWD